MRSANAYDVVVVGARCAGAATAMLLARRGLRVLVVDRGQYGTDTLSTHALMRGGVLQLHRWGVLPAVVARGTPPVRTTTFHYGAEAIEVAIKPGKGIEALYAPRRTVLDAALVDAARAAGAELRYGQTLADLRYDGEGRVVGAVTLDAAGRLHEIAADLVIGADGIGSAVARLVRAEVTHQARHATATVFGYFADIPDTGYHWHYVERASVGRIPTNDGRTCVFVSVPPSRYRTDILKDRTAGFHAVLREVSPALAGQVAGSVTEGGLLAFAGRRSYLRQAHGPGWALVGDAGYFKDPITAHGITDALRDAELLAEAAVRGSAAAFAEYQATRDALSRPLLDVTDAIAAYDWDLEQAKTLHKALNQAMKREVEHILALDADATREAA
ncbi:FAD-dependent monooxygenase [Elioraea sp. Yellowstone]|jgi:2-polyprenyl-6-methoxyphenol hydroxylase-like FAD-dependent oxidoreductase|uniref:NAD(P)/FAD-dependent oxidoreductase n=1 Tax=Elioraea sp. Yellowstone TaxID=2592070 RepID=UPI00115030E1|nr:NAD(P)/FAD-dependent oxidoreductase [Elioraea sp. Yellowstone]TQF82495.1 FAD-dependent monooxygenase [Elioraea sp. Yellowstone]